MTEESKPVVPSVPTARLLDGHAAIITGAAQGIGFAVAQLFVVHGASVVLVDIDHGRATEAAATLREDGAAVEPVGVDVTSLDDTKRMVDRCREAFGRVDVLVNNAGVTRDGYISRMTEADFDLVLDVSLKGAWLGTKAVAGLMREQKHGAIVNMSSLSGKIGNPGQTNYSAAKAGLIGLTKAAAKELGPSGVRVNAVQPGLIRTAMTLAMKPEFFEAKEAEVPLGRAGEPEEVASAALFLASALASYINGCVLEVTGGRGI